MSEILTDTTDILLDEMATEFEIPLDEVFGDFDGILNDPETKRIGLNKFDTAQYAVRILRNEYTTER